MGDGQVRLFQERRLMTGQKIVAHPYYGVIPIMIPHGKFRSTKSNMGLTLIKKQPIAIE